MTVISTESWIVACELMLTDALGILGITIPIHEIFDPAYEETLPVIYLDDWNVHWHLNTVSGSIDVIYLVSYDGTTTNQQNLITHRNNLFNLYSTFKTMPRKDSYIIEPTIDFNKGIAADPQSFEGTNRVVWGAFTVNFGLSQSS